MKLIISVSLIHSQAVLTIGLGRQREGSLVLAVRSGRRVFGRVVSIVSTLPSQTVMRFCVSSRMRCVTHSSCSQLIVSTDDKEMTVDGTEYLRLAANIHASAAVRRTGNARASLV